jgi:hypothetical protein
MIQIIHEDLLKANETYICHQTNCVTNKSAHLSQAVFTEFPYADIYTCRKGYVDTPGTIIVKGAWASSERPVVNMLGQYYPGHSRYKGAKKDGEIARLRFFKSCLSYMLELEGSFAFPWKIGCGAAGGDWEHYLDHLIRFSDAVKGDVVIYKLPPVKKRRKPKNERLQPR